VKKLFILTILLLISTPSVAEENLIPQQIEWEGETYTYAPHWKEYENVIYGDFDGDGVKEIAVSFMGNPKDVDIHRPFYLIYDVIDGKTKPVKTIIGNEYLGDLKVIDLERDGKKELAIFTYGEFHYTNLSIYRYELGDYRRIFDEGSACPVRLKDDAIIPQVQVGRANWGKENWCYGEGFIEDNFLWEVYTWNGEKFVYSRELSTAPQLGECGESNRCMDQFKGLMGEVTKELNKPSTK